MLKNQIAYQIMMHKTNSKIVSLITAQTARIVGKFAGTVFGIAKNKHISKSDEKILYKKAEEIFKKPQSQNEKVKFPEYDENIDVSIIVPAYNAEKYIKACIDNIVNQKTSVKTQIIIINDGSTDNTKDIISGYSELDNVICINKENGKSAASARNFGLSYATGKYVMFVDSDDMLFLNAVDRLYSAITELDVDIVQGSWQYMSEDGAFGYKQAYIDHTYANKTRADMLDLPGMPWGKIFKRELFKNINFPAYYTCFEDAIIQFLVFRTAKKVASISDLVYAWRKNSVGLTSTSQNQPKAMQAYWIVEELLDLDKKLNLPHDEIFARSLAMQLSNFCYACVSNFDYEKQKLVFEMCANLYNKNCAEIDFKTQPYAIRIADKALKEYNFEMWRVQGKLARLIR